MGSTMVLTRVVPCLALRSASSLPAWPWCALIQCRCMGIFVCSESRVILQSLILLDVEQFHCRACKDDLESDMMSMVSMPCVTYLVMLLLMYVQACHMACTSAWKIVAIFPR
jgi:hypothetical protein